MPLKNPNLSALGTAGIWPAKAAILACAVIAAATLMIAASSGPASAADDEDDDWFDVKIMRKVLNGIGLRRDGAAIEYRERSPLVVPPSTDLPRPEANAAANNPAWPVDPDVKARKD